MSRGKMWRSLLWILACPITIACGKAKEDEPLTGQTGGAPSSDEDGPATGGLVGGRSGTGGRASSGGAFPPDDGTTFATGGTPTGGGPPVITSLCDQAPPELDPPCTQTDVFADPQCFPTLSFSFELSLAQLPAENVTFVFLPAANWDSGLGGQGGESSGFDGKYSDLLVSVFPDEAAVRTSPFAYTLLDAPVVITATISDYSGYKEYLVPVNGPFDPYSYTLMGRLVVVQGTQILEERRLIILPHPTCFG